MDQNEAQNHKKSKKKWRALRPVFLTFREPFLQAEYKMKPNIIKGQNKKMAGAPPCISHFSGAVSAGRVQNEAQNHTKSTTKMPSAPPCISHVSGAVSAGRVQNETQNYKKSTKNGGRSALHFSLFGSQRWIQRWIQY